MAKKNTHTEVKNNPTSINKTVSARTNIRSSKTVGMASADSNISESDKLTLRAWKHTYLTHGEGRS
jgi:hypothetical protein